MTTPPPRRILIASTLIVAVLVAACSGGPLASPAGPSGPGPTPTTVAPSTSPSPSVPATSPTLVPSEAASPSGTAPTSPVACTLPGPGRLASDTLTNALLEPTASGSRLTFVFGTRPPEAIAQPTIGIGFVQPPFSMAGSGQPVTVAGERFLKVRMGGMVVARPNGDPVYTGQRDLRLSGGTIAQAVLVDESEGVVTWIVGLTGSGCPSLTRDAAGGEKLVIEVAG